MIYILIHIVGFILTLTFLKLFAKKMGIDYDPPHEDDYDDYKDNVSAYLIFSLFWILLVPLSLIIVIFNLLHKFTKWFLKL